MKSIKMGRPDPFLAFQQPPVQEKKSIFSFAIQRRKKVVSQQTTAAAVEAPVEASTEAPVEADDVKETEEGEIDQGIENEHSDKAKETGDAEEETGDAEENAGEADKAEDETVEPEETNDEGEAHANEPETLKPEEVNKQAVEQSDEPEEKQYYSPFRYVTKRSATPRSPKGPIIKIPHLLSKLENRHQRELERLEQEKERQLELKKQQDDQIAKNREQDERKLKAARERLEQLKIQAEQARLEAEGPKKEEPEEEEAEGEVEERPLRADGEEETGEETTTKEPQPIPQIHKVEPLKKKHRLFGIFPIASEVNKNPDGTPMTVQQKIDYQNEQHKIKLDAIKKKNDDEYNRIQNAFDNQIEGLKAEIAKIEDRIQINVDNTDDAITKANAEHEEKAKELEDQHEENKKTYFQETEDKIKSKYEEIEQSKKDQEEAAEQLKELEDKQVESSEKLKVYEQDCQDLRDSIAKEKAEADNLVKEKESKLLEIANLKQLRIDHENKIKEAALKKKESEKVITDFENNTHQKDIDDINEQIKKLNEQLAQTKQKSEASKLKSDQLNITLESKEKDHAAELDNKAKLESLIDAAETNKKTTDQKVNEGEKELNDLKTEHANAAASLNEVSKSKLEDSQHVVSETVDSEPVKAGPVETEITSEPTTTENEALSTKVEKVETKASSLSILTLETKDEGFQKEQEALLAKLEKARKKREELAQELKKIDETAYNALNKDIVA